MTDIVMGNVVALTAENERLREALRLAGEFSLSYALSEHDGRIDKACIEWLMIKRRIRVALAEGENTDSQTNALEQVRKEAEQAGYQRGVRDAAEHMSYQWDDRNAQEHREAILSLLTDAQEIK